MGTHTINSWTAALTTSETLLNFKGQGHMGYRAFLSAWYPRAVLSLERGFYLFSLFLSILVHVAYCVLSRFVVINDYDVDLYRSRLFAVNTLHKLRTTVLTYLLTYWLVTVGRGKCSVIGDSTLRLSRVNPGVQRQSKLWLFIISLRLSIISSRRSAATCET